MNNELERAWKEPALPWGSKQVFAGRDSESNRHFLQQSACFHIWTRSLTNTN